MFNIAIFASGTGTNAAKIIDYFSSVDDISVELVVSNKASAGVLAIAEANSIDAEVFSRVQFISSAGEILRVLQKKKIQFLVLAGFLLKLPGEIVEEFDGRIVNIHPSLLPDFGGKGMYGDHVHKAVLAAGKTKSGITIHQVNNEYDRGKIVFQKEVAIGKADSLATLKEKIQVLEHTYFPQVIENEIKKLAK